jgi:hypothetical protein
VLAGVLAGAAAVALIGLALLAVDRAAAVQAATYDLPERYRGLGENPNTVPMLLALALPPAAWFAVTARRRTARWGAAALVLLVVGSIGASGSRGALAAGAIGMLVVAAAVPVPARVRAAIAGAVVVLCAAGVVAGELEPPGRVPTPPATAAVTAEHSRYANVDAVFPLSFDVGANPSARHLLGTSGRVIAWEGAIHDGEHRPLLGYGFGTEAKAFVDRYLAFEGDLPENSYIGLFLQLGAVGLALFAGLALALLWTTAAALRHGAVGACLGVVVAGLVLAVVQSYVYSVGNIATVTLWICAFLGLAAAARARSEPA